MLKSVSNLAYRFVICSLLFIYFYLLFISIILGLYFYYSVNCLLISYAIIIDTATNRKLENGYTQTQINKIQLSITNGWIGNKKFE